MDTFEFSPSEITGVYEVELTTGETREVAVKRNFVDSRSFPLYLESEDGRLYTWQNIISIKKKS